MTVTFVPVVPAEEPKMIRRILVDEQNVEEVLEAIEKFSNADMDSLTPALKRVLTNVDSVYVLVSHESVEVCSLKMARSKFKEIGPETEYTQEYSTKVEDEDCEICSDNGLNKIRKILEAISGN